MDTPFDDDLDLDALDDEKVKKAEEGEEEKQSTKQSKRFRATFAEYFSSLGKLKKVNDDSEDDEEEDVVIKKEGFLEKQSRHLKRWRKRYVRIEGKSVCCYEIENCGKLTEKINLKGTEVIFSTDKSKQFLIEDSKNKKSWLFRCDDEQETQNWIQSIDDIQTAKGLLVLSLSD